MILLLPMTAGAQTSSDSFVVSVFGAEDTEAPTTPTLQTIDPVTPTQINIGWSTATDNYTVSGYVVERDGVVIATTTQESYADSGLLPETTYAYVVRAFDVALNYSSSSNALATTTPAVPVPPPPTEEEVEPASQGTAVRAVADSIEITEAVTAATFDITMARPSSLQLRWGRTGSYELGYVVSDVFVREHSIPLADLEPRTTYEYELVGYMPHGGGTVLERGTFTTEGVLEDFLPENVQRFRAVADGVDVRLSFDLPADQSDIAYVRVLRSNLGFPTHVTDGAVVYQGRENSVAITDQNILAAYSPVYYTAFVVDTDGRVSSGAITLAMASEASQGLSDEPVSPTDSDSSFGRPAVPGETGTTIQPTATSSVDTDRLPEYSRIPELTDITITQEKYAGAAPKTLNEPDLTLSAETSFVVSIPTKNVSNNLKTIIVSVLDPTDTREYYSYLLRLNQDRTAYEATVPALNVLGRSQITVEVFDFEQFVVSRYQAPVTFAAEDEVIDDIVFPDVLFELGPLWWGVFVLLLLVPLLWLWFLARRQS